MKRAFLAALMLAATSLVAIPTAAQASTTALCQGTLIDSKQLKSSAGDALGHVELYYSSANNGTNCVITYDDVSGSNNMQAQVQVGNTKACDPSDCTSYGYYSTYAGPVTVTNTNGRCIWFYGAMIRYSTTYKYASGWSHCG